MTLVLTLFLTGMMSYILTTAIRRHAPSLGLVAIPNSRSSHTEPTPHGGGAAIVVASTVFSSWLAWPHGKPVLIALSIAMALALVGLVDDIRPQSARLRFGVQLGVVVGLLALTRNAAPFDVSGASAPTNLIWQCLLLLAGVWWINLFNFMDGIDGIAGVQAIAMLLAGAALAAWHNPDAFGSPAWLLAICTAVATMGFLAQNWPPAKIFMGDVGGTWLAFVVLTVALLTIRSGWLNYTAWLVLGAVFVTDATITLLTRLARGEHYYHAHRSHAYQRLSRRWHGDRKQGHRSVTLLVLVIDVVWLFPLAWACIKWPQWSLVWLALAYVPLSAGVISVGAGLPDHA